MKRIAFALLFVSTIVACKQEDKKKNANAQFGKLCDQYYEDYLKLNPISATYAGDDRYNSELPNDGSVAYLSTTKSFYKQYLDSLGKYKREQLDANDKLSFDVLR
ncbi:hypothetical protein [Pedobacter sp. NJ-S-72]